MRRLATLCIPALLLAVPVPAMAANDGVIVFAPPETQAAGSASADAAPASSPLRPQSPCADDTAGASSKRC